MLAESLILERIGALFPEDSVLAEESRTRLPDGWVTGLHEGRVWLVDPLDGTVNYAHGVPFFCTSIALIVHGLPVVGVVYDPLRNELFSARRGEGAWLGKTALRVSASRQLRDCLVAVEAPERGASRPLARLRRTVRSVRETGSAALALAYMAGGRFDAFWEPIGLAPWDIGAAGLIAMEAGANVTHPRGLPWLDLAHPRRHSLGLLAAAPARHGDLAALLAGRPSLAGDRKSFFVTTAQAATSEVLPPSAR